MSNSAKKAKEKALKKEQAEKKAKLKRTLIICICSLAVAAVLGYFALSAVKKGESSISNQSTETYSYRGQIVRLSEDGTFTASLAHNVRKSGTYAKSPENGRISVSFNMNGAVETGWIINDSLHLPKEWEDSHGHGNVFPKEN